MRRFLVVLLLLTGCESRHLPRQEPMALPDSRERTYNDDSPVDPNDLNAIQDSIIALHLQAAGERRQMFAAGAEFRPIAGDEADVVLNGVAVISTGASGYTIYAPIRAQVGQMIRSIVLWWVNPGAGAGTFTWRIVKREIGSDDFAMVEIATSGAINPPNDGLEASDEQGFGEAGSGDGLEIEAGWLYWVEVVSSDGTAPSSISSFELVSDFLAK